MDVRTSAAGTAPVDFENIKSDVIAAVDNTYDLGSIDKKWAYLWVAIAMVTSLTIGGVIGLSNVNGLLFVNASTQINESLWVVDNITGVNITASGYFFGDGSKLTGISVSETDPYWTGNQSSYSTTATILGFSYWNNSYATFNKTYADTLYSLISEPLWTTNFSAYNSSWSSTYNATYDAKVSFPGWDSNLAWINASNTFTANQNLATKNITAIKCIIFDSGGKICSGA